MSGSERHVALPRFDRDERQVRGQQLPRREQVTSATSTVAEPRRQRLDRSRSSPLWRDRGVICFAVSGLLLVVGWLISLNGSTRVATAVYFLATFVGSYLFAREAFTRLVLRRQVTLELMLSVIIVVALLTGEVAIAAIIAFVYSITQVGVSPAAGAPPAKSARGIPLRE